MKITLLGQAMTAMIQTALTAGEALLKLQPRAKRLSSGKDFLCNADLKADKLIINGLRKAFPKITALSEESGGRRNVLGYQWVIDPLDGSLNYFQQDDHWGISIALLEHGKTVAAVVYLPGKKQLFTASTHSPVYQYSVKNHCIHSVRRVGVNIQANLSQCQVWVAWGKEKNGGEDNKKVCDVLGRLVRKSKYPGIRNSATADLMHVACGNIAGHIFLKPEACDIAAAAFIVEQAGGKVTTPDGGAWNPFSPSVVSSNGKVHRQVLEIVNG